MLDKINKKYIAIIGGVILLIIGIILFIIFGNNKKLSQENIDLLNNYSNCFEYIDKDLPKENKYVAFAVMYNYLNNDTTKVDRKAVIDTVKEVFDVRLTDDDLNHIGGSIDINFVSYSGDDKFIIAKENANTIKNKKITKYVSNSTKTNKVIYDKYVISNPYEVLDYYSNTPSILDLNNIKDYINGKTSESSFIKYITDDVAKSIGKKEDKFTIKYKLNKKNKLYLVIEE